MTSPSAYARFLLPNVCLFVQIVMYCGIYRTNITFFFQLGVQFGNFCKHFSNGKSLRPKRHGRVRRIRRLSFPGVLAPGQPCCPVLLHIGCVELSPPFLTFNFPVCPFHLPSASHTLSKPSHPKRLLGSHLSPT